MKTNGNTILITGGSSGIGFELAKQFLLKGNQVIITGRNPDKLKKAASQLTNLTTLQSDITNGHDVDILTKNIFENYPQLNIVINNAGVAFPTSIVTGTDLFEKSSLEMLTNYLSVVRLNERLMPQLEKQKDAAIVNVTSRVALVPRIDSVTYSASKAALHSYTQALRILLSKTNIKVFELMPPVVDTAFSAKAGGKNGISPMQVSTEFLSAFENNKLEIHVAGTEHLYQLYLKSPEEALNFMNNIS